MGNSFNHRGNYAAELEVGERKFSKDIDRNATFRGWYNSDAVPVVKSFISGDVVKYKYAANAGPITDSVSLKGFTKAWQHAVSFTKYDPLATRGR